MGSRASLLGKCKLNNSNSFAERVRYKGKELLSIDSFLIVIIIIIDFALSLPTCLPHQVTERIHALL